MAILRTLLICVFIISLSACGGGGGGGGSGVSGATPANPAQPRILSTPSAQAYVGLIYRYDITVTGNPEMVVTVSGQPTWLIFDDARILSGTPSFADVGTTGQITVTATNGIGEAAMQTFTINISPDPDAGPGAAPTITSSAPTDATSGTLYSYDITVTGSPFPALSVSGNPAWLTLAGTTLSGTPSDTDVGTAGPITITATNGNAPDATEVFSINVSAVDTPPMITSTAPTTASVGVPYTYTITATGFPTPTISAMNLPGWLTLNGADLTGTPLGVDAGQSAVITITANNGIDPEATQDFQIDVDQPALGIRTSSLPGAVLGEAYSETLGGIGGTGIYSWSIVGGGLPPGLTLAGDTISGTPTDDTGSPYSFDIELMDDASATAQMNYFIAVTAPVQAGSWIGVTNTMAPAARYRHTAIWDDVRSEMIVFGGFDGTAALGDGARYNPGTDTWTALSSTNAPSARYGHTAVWTGSAMIIWGGWDGTTLTNDGASYDPATDTWTALDGLMAPTARYGHTAVWSGTDMVIFGGNLDANNGRDDGGSYNPGTDTWVAVDSAAGIPGGRDGHTAVWTNSGMLVWGGYNGGTSLKTGASFVAPATWNVSPEPNFPEGRQYHTALWDSANNRMLVWGGYTRDDQWHNTGATYVQNLSSWNDMSTASAPDGRWNHSAVWTGTNMIVWGGRMGVGGTQFHMSGGLFNPDSNTWTATQTSGAPSARANHTAVWTGTAMIIWGGTDGTALADGAVFAP